MTEKREIAASEPPLECVVRWVACEDLHPPRGENVTMYLIVNAGYFVTVGFWHPASGEWSDGRGSKIKVTHWSRMPAPPNG